MDKAWNGKEKRKDKEKIQRSPPTPGRGVTIDKKKKPLETKPGGYGWRFWDRIG